MNILMVFFSNSGRTRAVANAIVDGLDIPDIKIEELKFDGTITELPKWPKTIELERLSFDKSILDLSQFDLIFIGTPTHGQHVATPVAAFIEGIFHSEGKDWVIFSTSRFWPGKILDRLKAMIEKHGGRVINRAMFKGLLSLDTDAAQEFGRNLDLAKDGNG